MTPDISSPRPGTADRDIALAEMKIARAGWASSYFRSFSLDQIRKIAHAVAQAAHDKADFHAEWAVRETGYGVREHKKLKNELSAFPLLDHYRDLDLVTPRLVPEKKIVEIPRPAGVVFALVPVTNPISTLIYKTLLAILSRNAIVFSPHPGARECSFDAARNLADAAEKAGAPSGLIQCVEKPSVPLVQRMMASDKIAVIMATGGGAMVRAAYSSSNPALGVGPGNAVVYVDPSAKFDETARRIVDSKSFDNSVLCTNESVLLTLDSCFGNMVRALRSAGAHICTEDDTARLREYLFKDGKFNLAALGKSAVWIAEKAGIRAAKSARILVPLLENPNLDDLFLKEKLCPVLGMARVADFQHALTLAKQIMRRGAGHSAAFHGEDSARLLAFAQAMPVYRVVVNAPSSQGAAGFATHLPPAFMVGTGFAGRSSIGENVGPQHLVHWTRIAFNKDDAVPFGRFDLDTPAAHPAARADRADPPPARPATAPEPSGGLDRDLLRQLILEELKGITGSST